ncbi:Zn-dependent amino-or carboxypeptidase, M28 family [Roseivivax lentus]|uniref:Zn-dependent amino-or carboxypeptidase, M28 family n=1 Tax=Roseivivax lentus TaxID=633194 RepID=A0A1N7NAK9_9RHOB|nr:M28 family peptidase [Roseivivax lentus]SIS95394.1 Zn-dependent amino-or carboxypeptidase, M28 family [Roseivivax lentus]
MALASAAAAGPKSCENRSNNNIAKLTECVTLEGVRAHQSALQEIANDSFPNNRASGFEGYDRSVDYVVEQLTAAGYSPVIQPFDFVIFNENSDAMLEQTAPVATTYEYLVDFFTMSYSGSGTASGPVEPVDLDLGRGNASSSGCEIADFAGFTAGSIALIQRGACSFEQKANNAEASGAIGVIIFNQGNADDGSRDVLFGGTLSDSYVGDLPVVSATYDRGVEWAGTAGLEMTLTTDTTREPFTTVNVLAETNTGDPENIVMVGAHLDSVNPGPGINDNGSGSAAILETAIQMSKVNLVNKVRFAWWGAEESGLIGSTFYVNDLIDKFFAGDDQIFDIALYLNFDMVGSPNYVFKIYDGDDSDEVGAGPGPDGSAQIEAFFEGFYESRGEPYKGTDFSGRSDYGPFIDLVGIPAGGLFTGAEEIKSDEEAAIWGGTAGEQLDPCYHLVCDTFDNNSDKALDINSDAIAASTLYYGMNTSEINGVEGKGNFTNGAALRQVGFMTGMEMLGKRFQK